MWINRGFFSTMKEIESFWFIPIPRPFSPQTIPNCPGISSPAFALLFAKPFKTSLLFCCCTVRNFQARDKYPGFLPYFSQTYNINNSYPPCCFSQRHTLLFAVVLCTWKQPPLTSRVSVTSNNLPKFKKSCTPSNTKCFPRTFITQTVLYPHFSIKYSLTNSRKGEICTHESPHLGKWSVWPLFCLYQLQI